LERRVQMRRQVARRFDEQASDSVVHLGSFDRGKAEADLGDGCDEGFEQLTQGRLTPGRCPGVPPDNARLG